MAIPIEIGPRDEEERIPNEAESEIETEETEGVKIGDVIDSGGEKMRVMGYTAPKGNPGRCFVLEKLTSDEMRKYQQREDIIEGKIKNQIESNPDAIVDAEQARKYWGRLYDQAGDGDKMDMQINEIYAKRYEQGAESMRNKVLILEQKLQLAKDEAEKQALNSEITQLNNDIASNEREAHYRRGYNNPKK